MSETFESKVRDLDDPATIQQTIGTLQTTVKLQRTFVNVFHSLTDPHNKKAQLSLTNPRDACEKFARFT